MNRQDIVKARTAAENNILEQLRALQDLTGLTPESVSVQSIATLGGTPVLSQVNINLVLH